MDKDTDALIAEIRATDNSLLAKFQHKLATNADLNRTLVSFQGNKRRSGYRWFKFKEGYSAQLIAYILNDLQLSSGNIVDPFAGSGVTLFAAAENGMNSVGIELLPIGREIMNSRLTAMKSNRNEINAILDHFITAKPWHEVNKSWLFPHLNITQGAFSEKTQDSLERYITACVDLPPQQKEILQFAALCILEDISFTRKDGQYLRWDSRATRTGRIHSSFQKEKILEFDLAIENKLTEIRSDLGSVANPVGSISVIPGSCLTEMRNLSTDYFDCLITSPPYCNRYDYTRTYALELAMLGVDECGIKKLRQAMLTCTVENRVKDNLQLSTNIVNKAETAFTQQSLLQQILQYLDALNRNKLLNNTGIPRMVKNYFWEMTLLLVESHRILKSNSPMVIVNDNVKYEDVMIPVDLILCDIAEAIGFHTEKIWVLPSGKGNSSQQMGKHGREQLRKCIYVLRK
jgi:DNA modification methylase